MTKVIKKQYIKEEDIPTEVLEAEVILYQKMVGSFLYNKVLETIKKYPQYFPKHIIKDNVIYSKDE